MNALNALEKIFKVDCKTIQKSSFLETLTKDQRTKLNCIVNRICYSLNSPKKRVTLVFRGDNFKHLASKLSSNPNGIDQTKLFSLLFYFGDKAKHYYKHEDKKIAKSRWIKNIEDQSMESSKVIFNKIKKVLKSKNKVVLNFKKSNTLFVEYFAKKNIDSFATAIANNNRLRDYYLFFLHVAGKIGVGEKSLLVSTSKCFDVARKFSGLQTTKFIIYYVIPHPINKFAVTHFSIGLSNLLKTEGLPSYNGKTLYPAQHEIAIKGALFSHNMLGVMVETENKDCIFAANPHLFSPENRVESILDGLYFDQDSFEKNLEKTGYYRGVGTFLDGEYFTIYRPT